jgi:dipeptidyl-peptidase-4
MPKVRRATIALSAIAVILLVQAAALAQNKLLTVDAIYDPEHAVKFGGSLPKGLHWLPDGQHYLEFKPPASGARAQLCRVEALTGTSVPFYDSVKMESALARAGISAEEAARLARRESYHMNPAETAVLINHGNDLYYYELNSDRAVRLTNDAAKEVGEEFSPDGGWISFVSGNNLSVIDIAGQHRHALTTDGTDKILNGRLDWVYQEELYGRGNFQAYWWSPDSAKITFLRLDETAVPNFTVVDEIPYDQNVEVTPYPKAGDPNPSVKLGIVAASGGNITWVDLGQYEKAEPLIPRVAWSGDCSKVAFQIQDREQTWLDLDFADPATGKFATVIHEKTSAWVEVIDNPVWLADGTFLWQSERTGWRHLYLYSKDGKLIRQVTNGKWEVRGIEALDPAGSTIYFVGTEHSHIASNVYRIRLDGTGLTRLSQQEGSHRPEFNPTATMYFDNWSDATTPTQIRLYTSDGRLARVIAENKVAALGEYKLGKSEFVQVKTKDGFVMEAQMIKPPDFDPSRRYPVLCFTYSGPHSQSVRNAWEGQGYMWHQMIAEHGYIVWICDNRTASGKGVVSTWPVFHNFGELELRDLEDGVAWLKSQPYVDGSRIGLWGWSFGGFMTAYALTHSKSFKIGMAGGTVSDWRDYDSIYTERYMGTPQNNPQGYEKSSVRGAAGDLSGRLLLMHGTIDDNVHIANTMQLVYALENAGREFQLMVYPKSRHAVRDPVLIKHLRQTMADFVFKNL